ncbi:MAG: EFR1 family ferrodoxin [Eubacterium sp.]|nr:EFR1 family ferrodoxin [Eubacterium sp.]
MKITNITAVYFSPTGSTRKIVEELARVMADEYSVPMHTFDFTLPENRVESITFQGSDLVVFGVPVYAGRVPNKILPEIRRIFKGDGALAVPVVTFGNRSYDNALIELRNELEEGGFHTIAGGAFVAEHAFSGKLAPGRPDREDMDLVRSFAKTVADKVNEMKEIPGPVKVRGIEPIPPYYQPLGIDGRPAKFLKAKPVIGPGCIRCGKCINACPMGSINEENDELKVEGICIKCQACIKICPVRALFFDDSAFLSHVAMLEQNFSRKAENEVFPV